MARALWAALGLTCATFALADARPPLGPPAPRDRQVLRVGGRTYDLLADEIRAVYGQRQVVQLRGAARIITNQTRIEADDLTLDLTDVRHVTAHGKGHIRIKSEGTEATGVEGVLDLGNLSGWVTDPLISSPLAIKPRLRDLLDPDERPAELRISATSARLLPAQAAAPGSTATPPRYAELTAPAVWVPQGRTPQFMLRAASARMRICQPGCLVDPVDALKMRDVRLKVGGLTILRLPELHLGLGGLYLPYFGVDKTYGAFVEQAFSMRMGGLRLRTKPRFGTEHIMTGALSLEYPTSAGTLAFGATHRERVTLPVSRNIVQYSRIPELSFAAEPLRVPGIGGELTASARVGLIKEHGTGTLWRSRYDLGWHKRIFESESSSAEMTARTQWSYGDGGYHYGWAGGGLSFEHNFYQRAWVKLGVNSNWVSGTTPFRHERLEAPTLVSGEFRWRPLRHWVVEDALAYDLDAARLSDHRASLLYRDRLIEYGLTVRTLPTFEVQLAAGVLGF